VITDLEEAMALLIGRVVPEEEPVLSEDQLYRLLDRAARATVWTASTAYAYGDVVVPTTRQGHRYRVVEAGTSDATEPDWTTVPGYAGGFQTDGGVIWQEDGLHYLDLWDVDQAAHEGWLLKAAMAAGNYEFTEAGLNLKRQQVVQHCRQMALTWAPYRVT
jgi:hypothetical protein